MLSEHASGVWKQAFNFNTRVRRWQYGASRYLTTSTRTDPFHHTSRPRLNRRLLNPSPPCESIIQRGAKRRTSVSIQELPQGPIIVDAAARILPDDKPEKLTVVEQAMNNMIRFPHCVLLTRVGGFYELYHEHAEIYGPMLNLKVASRKSKDGSISMAGFPYYQLDRYLKIMVQDLGKHVAISEEFANDPSKRVKSGLLFDRRVSRIISPGTLIDENFMDPFQNNFLLSIHLMPTQEHPKETEGVSKSQEVGLAWIDLSSGDFFTQRTTLASLPAMVARIGPREILLDDVLDSSHGSPLVTLLKEDGHIITFSPRPENIDKADWTPMLGGETNDFDVTKFTDAEITAGGSLLHYVQKQLLGSGTRLQMPIRHQSQDFMSIDKNSLRALEIKATLRDGRYEGSLLHAIKRTVTKSGTRLLTQRISAPSMSIPVINERLDLVSLMVEDDSLRERLVALLRRTFDTLRLVQKFTFGRGDADDLMELSQSIKITDEIASTLNTFIEGGRDALKTTDCVISLRSLLDKLSLEQPMKMAERILDSIDEDGLSERHRLEDSQAEALTDLAQDIVSNEATEEEIKQLPKRVQPKATPQRIISSAPTGSAQEPFIMRRSASKILSKLHTELDKLSTKQDALQESLRISHKADSLTLKWTPSLGHICHVKGRDTTRLRDLPHARSVSSSKSTGSFHLPEWTRLGADMDETRLRIRTEELRVLSELRAEVVRNLVKLRRNAAVLDELDVACGFATLAVEKSWIRPIVNNSTSLNIVGGRHPVVEGGLRSQGRSFTANDCVVNGRVIDAVSRESKTNNSNISPTPSSPPSAQILIVTGPNMAGKSTFLRQNAILCILSQSGSFVPASYAAIGLVDALFSRVGTADNLYLDQSTFMLEMSETAHILQNATSRSFVVMDEVGRGTTPEDGVAVGYACLEYLHDVIGCRTVFATHFHNLTELTTGWDGVECWCSDVLEDEGSNGWVYVHKLRKGVNRQSHALKVAKVAGLPDKAIRTAEMILERIKGGKA